MKEKNKLISIILVVLLLVSIFCSYHFFSEYAHHDCIGEDCPVCAQMETAIQFLSGLKFIPVLSCFMAVLSVFTLFYKTKEALFSVKQTLVSLHIELLD